MENDGGTLPNIIIFVVKSGGFPQFMDDDYPQVFWVKNILQFS